MISRSFQTVRRMREAWKWETYVRSQSFLSKSAVKYLRVGRRKIEISPSPGRTRSVKCPIPQGQQRQSNPHPSPPPRHDIDRCIIISNIIPFKSRKRGEGVKTKTKEEGRRETDCRVTFKPTLKLLSAYAWFIFGKYYF